MIRRTSGLPRILLGAIALVGLAVIGLAVIGLVWAAPAVQAESGRLSGQYRGPTDDIGKINETDDTGGDSGGSTGGGDSGGDSGGGTEGGRSGDGGGDSGGGDSGGGDAGGGGGGGDDGGGGGGDDGGGSSAPPPDSGGGAGGGDGGGGDSGGGSGDDDPRGGAPGGGDSGGGDSGDTGGTTAPGTGTTGPKGGGKTDVSEVLRLWSFYWEHNREWLFDRVASQSRDDIRFAPWGSSWVLGRGTKSVREITPLVRSQVDEKILPVLLNALRDRNAIVRDAAVIALGKYGSADAVPQLIEIATKDPNAEVREDATLALGLTRQPTALPRLLGFLKGDNVQGGRRNVNHRCFAAFALGLLKQPEAVEPMLDELTKAVKGPRSRDTDDFVASVALGLGMIGDVKAVKLLGLLLSERKLGTAAHGHIAAALAKIGDESASRELRKAFKKGDPQVRASIALALGAYPDTAVVGFLKNQGLKDGEGQAKNFSAMSLARIGVASPADSIQRRQALTELRDLAVSPQKNRTLAQFAALGLALMGDDEKLGEMSKMVHEKRENDATRSSMALVSGILKDRTSRTVLEEILTRRGNDPKLRSYAALALAFLGDATVVPSLREVADPARGDVDDVRRGCILALGFVGDRDDIDYLLGAMTQGDNPAIRGAAVIAIGRMRDATAVDKLIKIVTARSNVSAHDRAYAVAALGYLADKDSVPYLSTIFENCNYRIEYAQLREVLKIL